MIFRFFSDYLVCTCNCESTGNFNTWSGVIYYRPYSTHPLIYFAILFQEWNTIKTFLSVSVHIYSTNISVLPWTSTSHLDCASSLSFSSDLVMGVHTHTSVEWRGCMSFAREMRGHLREKCVVICVSYAFACWTKKKERLPVVYHPWLGQANEVYLLHSPHFIE